MARQCLISAGELYMIRAPYAVLHSSYFVFQETHNGKLASKSSNLTFIPRFCLEARRESGSQVSFPGHTHISTGEVVQLACTPTGIWRIENVNC